MTHEEAEALIREHMDYGGHVKVSALAAALADGEPTNDLRKRLTEALLDAERAREERNREHVRLNAEWMAKCEELRKERDHYQLAAEAEAKFADEFRERERR